MTLNCCSSVQHRYRLDIHCLPDGLYVGHFGLSIPHVGLLLLVLGHYPSGFAEHLDLEHFWMVGLMGLSLLLTV